MSKINAMKRYILILLLAVTSTSVFANTSRKGNNDLFRRISNLLVFSEKEKADLGTGLAVVSFKINESGMIELVQVDASTENQKNAVTKKLQGIALEKVPYNPEAVYTVQVHFDRGN